jgi:hypothetical protein
MEFGEWTGGKPSGSRWKQQGGHHVTLRFQDVNYIQYFRYAEYGSEEKAWEAATRRQMEYCIEKKLPIANQHRLVQDLRSNEKWLEVRLTRDKTMLCDIDDLKSVELLRLYAHVGNRTFYAQSTVNGKSVGFHTIITGWKMVDHINRNGCDNRRKNLREATPFINARNRPIDPRNVSGRTGVSHNGTGYCTGWTDFQGNRKWKYFSIFELGEECAFERACDLRAEMEKKFGYHYEEAPDEAEGNLDRRCRHCGAAFGTRWALLVHRRALHPDAVPHALPPVEKPFACPACGVKMRAKRSLSAHVAKKRCPATRRHQ